MSESEATPGPVVELRQVTVDFPGVRALERVDLRVHRGEILALMGQNGAGKSTLLRVLTGECAPSGGTITVSGFDGALGTPAGSRSAGIAAVPQALQLSPTLTVAENVMLGHEERGRFGISWGRTRERARGTLTQLGLDLDPRTPLSVLPPATQQLVAVARAMVTGPRVLLLDEPTASLDRDVAERLLGLVGRLRDQGVAILLVTHSIEQAYAISDRIAILREGRVEGQYPTTQLDRTELISTMLGKDIESMRALGSQRTEHHHAPAGPQIARADGIGREGALAPTDLELHGGEIVGIAGLRGSGRTALAQLLSGVDSPDRGQLVVLGQALQLASPLAGLRARIVMTSENRKDEGVVGDLTVRENIVLALQALRGWTRKVSRRERDELVLAYADTLGLARSDLDRPARLLSGGTQQKILLARGLATRPRLLILDEPTHGIDVGARADIQRRVEQLARDGVGIVYISADLEEIVRLSDRIVVLKDHEKIGELNNGPGVSLDTIVELLAAGDEPEPDLPRPLISAQRARG